MFPLMFAFVLVISRHSPYRSIVLADFACQRSAGFRRGACQERRGQSVGCEDRPRTGPNCEGNDTITIMLSRPAHPGAACCYHFWDTTDACPGTLRRRGRTPRPAETRRSTAFGVYTPRDLTDPARKPAPTWALTDFRRVDRIFTYWQRIYSKIQRRQPLRRVPKRQQGSSTTCQRTNYTGMRFSNKGRRPCP